MKVVITLLLFVSCAAQADSLAGKLWLETNKEMGNIECPNAVKFHQIKFEVLNDCYGIDIKVPIVETGLYEYKNRQLKLKNRKKTQSGIGFLPGRANLTADIVNLTSEKLTLKVGNNYLYFISK